MNLTGENMQSFHASNPLTWFYFDNNLAVILNIPAQNEKEF